MKKVLAVLVAMALLLPAVLAIDTGVGLGGIVVETEDFPPLIWMCDSRIVLDDYVETGRVSGGEQVLMERQHNYAFEGEQIAWTVLVMDKNGIEKIEDVYVSVGPTQANGQHIEANCDLLTQFNCGEGGICPACNARIDEEYLTVFNPDVMAYYRCTLTIESAASMYGEYWVTANVVDLDGLLGTMDENEFWNLNPAIALAISGTPLNFGVVRPGTDAYSNTITVGNAADQGSGVMLDMFVTGTDFIDPMHSGAKCPTTNVLRLANMRYYAVNGQYSTQNDAQFDPGFPVHGAVQRNRDAEGYMNIEYGDYFNTALYNNAEVIQSLAKTGWADAYYAGNMLSPGSEMSITFKLSLPEPCNGDFTDGNIYFWGEAI